MKTAQSCRYQITIARKKIEVLQCSMKAALTDSAWQTAKRLLQIEHEKIKKNKALLRELAQEN